MRDSALERNKERKRRYAEWWAKSATGAYTFQGGHVKEHC